MIFTFDGRPSDSPFVETIWYAQSESAGSFISHATTHWEMVVTKFEGETSITVRGPETKATPAEVTGYGEFFGIIFKMGTYMPHLPIRKVLDRNDSTLPKASSKSFWLNGSAWELPTFDNADTFVNRLMRQDILVRDPIVNTVLQNHPQDYSVRTLRRHFLQATGLTHGTIRQIQRAQYATSLLQEGVSILDTVYEAGYFDQPHMTRSLKQFMGQTPAQIIGFNTPEQMSLLYNTDALMLGYDATVGHKQLRELVR